MVYLKALKQWEEPLICISEVLEKAKMYDQRRERVYLENWNVVVFCVLQCHRLRVSN